MHSGPIDLIPGTLINEKRPKRHFWYEQLDEKNRGDLSSPLAFVFIYYDIYYHTLSVSTYV